MSFVIIIVLAGIFLQLNQIRIAIKNMNQQDLINAINGLHQSVDDLTTRIGNIPASVDLTPQVEAVNAEKARIDGLLPA